MRVLMDRLVLTSPQRFHRILDLTDRSCAQITRCGHSDERDFAAAIMLMKTRSLDPSGQA